MVGCETLPTAIHGLPATSEFVTTVVSFSRPVRGCASGTGPGHIGNCVCPGVGCQARVCAVALPHATAKQAAKITALIIMSEMRGSVEANFKAKPKNLRGGQSTFSKTFPG